MGFVTLVMVRKTGKNALLLEDSVVSSVSSVFWNLSSVASVFRNRNHLRIHLRFLKSLTVWKHRVMRKTMADSLPPWKSWKNALLCCFSVVSSLEVAILPQKNNLP